MPKPGQAVSEAQIRSQLENFAAKGVIPRYGVPELIVFAQALPKTSVGELDKKVVRGLEYYCQYINIGILPTYLSLSQAWEPKTTLTIAERDKLR